MSVDLKSLTSIGWCPFFGQQLDEDDWKSSIVLRVMEVHRGQLILYNGTREISLPITRKMLTDDRLDYATVGDWLLLSKDNGEFIRLLDRKSLFKRRAAGPSKLHQLVAANVDTLFIVTSCNEDFNLSRLERYLALAFDAEVDPVVVLTKIDLSDTWEDYLSEVRKMDARIMVEAVNALDPDSLKDLRSWCKLGQTIAFMGSSGVGKSTLINTLGADVQKTAAIREGDGKGRHTTTHRSLLQLEGGALLLDSPGMRELQISDCEVGVSEVFADIETLNQGCRFKDCQHLSEPGCAVQAALEDESLDPRRLKNYKKLMAEQRHNASSLAERRTKDKSFGKLIKSAKGAKKSRQHY